MRIVITCNKFFHTIQVEIRNCCFLHLISTIDNQQTMVERKETSVKATSKRRIHIFSSPKTCPETQPELQNGNSLDPSKVSLSTESKCHHNNEAEHDAFT